MLKKTLLLSVISLFVLSGCSDTKEESTKEINKMVAKSDFKLKSLDNELFTVEKKVDNFILKEAEGKVVLFNIFGTWCPPCRAEAPHLARLQEKYSDTFKVIAIPVDLNISNEELKAWKEQYGAQYSIVNSKDNKPLANAMASSVNAGQNFPIPLMLMFKDGEYITHYVGAIPQEMIESDIKHALGI